MKTRTVRELSGEIWGEIMNYYTRANKKPNVDDLEVFIDTTLGVLARYCGATIENDENLPVQPLAPSFEEED